MQVSKPALEPQARKGVLLALLKLELFLLAVVTILGASVAVQHHDKQAGLRAALYCFLFLQPIFAWVVRDPIRFLIVGRTKRK